MEPINKFQSTSIEQIANKYLSKKENVSINKSNTNQSFNEILKSKAFESIDRTTELKFSKHASERLMDRNITLTPEQFERLETGTKKAEEKGIKESLMIMDDMAFIVNIKNNTVITAMDQKSNNENVFTNIDGAVII